LLPFDAALSEIAAILGAHSLAASVRAPSRAGFGGLPKRTLIGDWSPRNTRLCLFGYGAAGAN